MNPLEKTGFQNRAASLIQPVWTWVQQWIVNEDSILPMTPVSLGWSHSRWPCFMTYMQNDQNVCFQQHWTAAGFCLMSFVQCVAGMILATLCLGGLSCQIDLLKVQNLHLGSSSRGPLNKDTKRQTQNTARQFSCLSLCWIDFYLSFLAVLWWSEAEVSYFSSFVWTRTDFMAILKSHQLKDMWPKHDKRTYSMKYVTWIFQKKLVHKQVPSLKLTASP